MTDIDAYIQKLAVFNPLIEPTVYPAIQALQLPSGSRGMDAGCGIGLQTSLLAEAVDFILNHPDYYAFFTSSMFYGRVAV